MLYYTDEIRSGSPSEQLFFRPVVNNRELQSDPEAPLQGQFDIWNPRGNSLVASAQSANWNADLQRFEIELDTSDTDQWPIGSNYRAEISFTVDQSQYRRVFYFDVLADPWRSQLTSADLLALSPALSYEDDQLSPDFQELIAEAEEHIRLHLRARGVSPGLVRNKAGLDRCHRLLTLSLIYLRSASGQDSGHWHKQQQWREQYEQGFQELMARSEMDHNQNDVIDDGVENKLVVRLQP